MQTMTVSKVIGWTAPFIPIDVTRITPMIVDVIEWTLERIIERYKACYIVQGVVEVPSTYFDPLVTHAPVVRNSCLLILLSLTMKQNLHLNHMDVKTASLFSPPPHEVCVRFPSGCQYPTSHPCARLKKSLFGLKQAAADWCILQLNRLLAFESELKRCVADPCLYIAVKDGMRFYLLVHVDDYA